MRNAVMSGLALGTVVVEASSRSGARVQARLALAHGRPVFLAEQLLDAAWARELAARPGVHVVSAPDEITATIERLPSPERSWPEVAAMPAVAELSGPYGNFMLGPRRGPDVCAVCFDLTDGYGRCYACAHSAAMAGCRRPDLLQRRPASSCTTRCQLQAAARPEMRGGSSSGWPRCCGATWPRTSACLARAAGIGRVRARHDGPIEPERARRDRIRCSASWASWWARRVVATSACCDARSAHRRTPHGQPGEVQDGPQPAPINRCC